MPVPERRGVTRVRFARRWAASALVVAMASAACVGSGVSGNPSSPTPDPFGSIVVPDGEPIRIGALLAASGDAEDRRHRRPPRRRDGGGLPRRDLRRRARAAVRSRHRRRPHRGSLHRNLGRHGGAGARGPPRPRRGDRHDLLGVGRRGRRRALGRRGSPHLAHERRSGPHRPHGPPGLLPAGRRQRRPRRAHRGRLRGRSARRGDGGHDPPG